MDEAMEDMPRAASWGSVLLPDKWSLQSGVHGLCALFVSARQIQRGKESPNPEPRQYGAPSLLLAQMFDGPKAWETLARRQAHMTTGPLMVSMEQGVPTVKSHVRRRPHPFRHDGVCSHAFLRADTRNSPNISCKSVALCTGAPTGTMGQTHKRACTGALAGGCMSVRRSGRRGSDWEDARERQKERRDEKPGDKRTSPSLIEYGGRTERTA